MNQPQMQELITLMRHKDSHADIFDLMTKMKITMDDFHEYSFQLCPGSQVHLEIDTISSIQPHVHRFYEVIFVVQGENINYILDSQRYRLGKGSMLFIPPGHIHHPLLCQTNSQPYKRYVLWLEAAFFQSICQWFPSVGYLFEQCEKKDDYLLQCKESEYLKLQETFEALCQEARKQRYGWEAQSTFGALSIMNLLSRAYQNYSLTVVNSAEQTKFDAAICYINQNLNQQITLETVAQQLYVSKSTLNHLFQRNLGISPYQYIQQKRLLKAKLLILKGESMNSICEKCGFADYPTFYRAFRKIYGISPNNYKKTILTYE